MNKCNITSFVLSRLDKFKKGQYCVDDTPIIDNYVNYTGCLVGATCWEDNCSNPTVHITCHITVNGMVRKLDENKASIFMVDGNIVNGTPPYTYAWDFNAKEFDLVSGQFGDTLVIALKDGKTFTTVVSVITVLVTDSLGCKTAKACYLAPDRMHCENTYPYCPNPINLVAKNKQTYCPKPIGLIVRKKT